MKIKIKDDRKEKARLQALVDEKGTGLKATLEESRQLAAELQNQKEKAIRLESSLFSQEELEKNQSERLEKMERQFEVLANRIFEEKAQSFSRQSKSRLLDLIDPLGRQIESFSRKIEENEKHQSTRASLLESEIKRLQELNSENMGVAQELARALKGDSKTQGNWGEMILSKVLELSGLEKGKEYFTEESGQNLDGKRVRADVVIELPEQKHIVIDSKVSLTAYEKYVNSTDSTDMELFAKEHIQSLKSHISILASKKYQEIYPVNSPDFVLMFIPIETAFSLAVDIEHNLFNQAFEKNIVIVTPSTLLATLKTIEGLWKGEKQRRNALVIAQEAGRMYDKFAGFLEDMDRLGKQLDLGMRSYDSAVNKLKTGKGNLLGKAERLKKLGAQVSKQIQNPLNNSGDLNNQH